MQLRFDNSISLFFRFEDFRASFANVPSISNFPLHKQRYCIKFTSKYACKGSCQTGSTFNVTHHHSNRPKGHHSRCPPIGLSWLAPQSSPVEIMTKHNLKTNDPSHEIGPSFCCHSCQSLQNKIKYEMVNTSLPHTCSVQKQVASQAHTTFSIEKKKGVGRAFSLDSS